MSKEEFTKIEGWDATLEPCPFCGSKAELWERQTGDHVFQKVACCTKGDDGDECPMYLPSEGFYKSTKIEARNIWNMRAPAQITS
jgi:hypothetical protein